MCLCFQVKSKGSWKVTTSISSCFTVVSYLRNFTELLVVSPSCSRLLPMAPCISAVKQAIGDSCSFVEDPQRLQKKTKNKVFCLVRWFYKDIGFGWVWSVAFGRRGPPHVHIYMIYVLCIYIHISVHIYIYIYTYMYI